MSIAEHRDRLITRARDLPIFWRIFLPNAAVLAIAAALLALLPVSVSSEVLAVEAVGLVIALAAMVWLNLAVTRSAVAPLERLTLAIGQADLSGPVHVPIGGGPETIRLGIAFEELVTRLQRERRESGRRMLGAQERERVRLARELHDEIGQSLTGLMLELDHAARLDPEEVRDALVSTRETARELSDEIREIVRRLRPEALDDLGLRSALVSLARRFAAQADLTVVRGIDPDIDDLDAEAELVLYRVAQEALTNVARHAKASRVLLRVRRDDGRVRLLIADDGRGLRGAEPRSGLLGMQERAHLVGATLTLGPSELGGTEVRLDLPVAKA